LPFHVV